MELNALLAEIDRKKAALDSRIPLPVATEESIRRAVRLEWTYHSNALAGNPFSLRETQIVLEGPPISGDELQRQHQEVMNHAFAVDFVERLVERGEPASGPVACRLHTAILWHIDDFHGGRWRDVPVAISGSRHIPPPPGDVPSQMVRLFNWYRNVGAAQLSVVQAARFYHRFLCIRPFREGNGRTARLLMNLMLMSQGYPPVIIKGDPQGRIAYLDALETASVDGIFEPLEVLVAEAVLDSLDRYLAWTTS